MTQTENEYNLQVGDKISIMSDTYTITSVTKEGIVFDKEFYTWSFKDINERVDSRKFIIGERAKKAFPEKWSVKGGRELVNFLDDCKSQGMYKLKNYAGNAQLYYNFDGQELSDYGNKKFEKVTVDQLREHYLNTKQNMEESKKIIGYNIRKEFKDKERKIAETLDTQVGKIKGAGYWLPNEGSVYSNAVGMGVLDLWFEPVYEEEEVKLTLGNPAKEVVVNKNGIFWLHNRFEIEEVKDLLKMFGERDGLHFIACVKKIWIGCDAGSEFTKEEILKVIKTAEELQ